jgi:glycerol-1-phosphate dehydrogenase [NAD(P)+]
MHEGTAPISLDSALRAARETRALLVGENVLKEVPRVFEEQFGARHAVLVADENTMAAAGQAVQVAFASAGHAIREPLVFGRSGGGLKSVLSPSKPLYAEYGFVEDLEAALREHDAIPVAVGSGTLNDVTKLAAHRAGRSYLCVATAASMDGYTAFGASITHQGSKQTFDCPAPVAVVADLGVIAAAPPKMNAWGYADLLAKVTAGADWIVADALGVEPIDALPWNIVQGRLREAVSAPSGIRTGAPEAMSGLVEGLMLGGFAMQATKSSRPASGAEHQFSHLWDMEHHTHEGNAPSHGLKVGIGTLAVTALYERLLAQPLESLDIATCCAAWPDESVWLQRAQALFDEGDLRTVATREIAAKHSSATQLAGQLERLREVWPTLRSALREQLIPFTTLREMLRSAGAATEPEEIGISRGRLRESFWKAFFIRRRFTALDLAVRTGLLDTLLDEIFGARGIWPPGPPL